MFASNERKEWLAQLYQVKSRGYWSFWSEFMAIFLPVRSAGLSQATWFQVRSKNTFTPDKRKDHLIPRGKVNLKRTIESICDYLRLRRMKKKKIRLKFKCGHPVSYAIWRTFVQIAKIDLPVTSFDCMGSGEENETVLELELEACSWKKKQFTLSINFGHLTWWLDVNETPALFHGLQLKLWHDET